MLNDIRLTPVQLAVLGLAARRAGGDLVPDYRGPFRPTDKAECIALLCSGPGELIRFAGMLTLCLDIGKDVLSQLAARVQEAPCGERRAYYWPGVLAPGYEPADPREASRVRALRAAV